MQTIRFKQVSQGYDFIVCFSFFLECIFTCWLVCMCACMCASSCAYVCPCDGSRWMLGIVSTTLPLLTEAGTQSNSELTHMVSVAIQLALGIRRLSLELQVGCRIRPAFMCVSGDTNFGALNRVANLFWVSHAPPPVYFIVFANVLFPF